MATQRYDLNFDTFVFIKYCCRRLDGMAGVIEYGFLLVGCLLGMALGWLLAKNRLGMDMARAEADATARDQVFDEKSKLLEAQMENVANRISQQNSEAFLQLAEER